jgi:hypothetical protein
VAAGAHRDHAEHRRLGRSPQQVAEQLERGIVGPVQVVEQEHQRPARGQRREQRADGGAAGKATVGHHAREAAAQQVAHVARQDAREPRVAGMAAEQDEGDDLAGVGVHGEVEPIAPQPSTVRARPALAQLLALAAAPVGQLVAVQRRPDAPRAVGQFRAVGRFHRPPHRLGREVAQAAAQRLGARQGGLAEQRGQQGLRHLAQMVGPPAPPPREGQPQQAEHQRREPAFALREPALQPQRLRIGEQARERHEIGGLQGRGRARYTAHEERAPWWRGQRPPGCPILFFVRNLNCGIYASRGPARRLPRP